MRSRRKLSLYFAAALCLSLNSCDDDSSVSPKPTPWVETNGPYAADVYSIAAPTATSLVGVTSAGVFRSTDGGHTWKRVLKTRDPYFPSPLTSNNAGLCLLGWHSGILRSTDAGSSWTTANASPELVYAHALLLAAGDTAYASSDAGVFRSHDSGTSWENITDSLPQVSVPSLSWSSNGYLFAATEEGIYRTSAASIHWDLVNQGLTWGAGVAAYAVACDPTGIVLASTSGGIHRSTDDGQNWTRVATRSPFNFTRTPNGDWFGGTFGDGIQVSRDGGVTWSLTGVSDISIESITSDLSGNVIAGTRGSGIRRSTDGGYTWEKPLPGPKSSWINTLVVTASGHLLAGANPGGLFRSTDDGASWAAVGPTAGFVYGYTQALAVSDGGAIYMADGHPSQFYVSQDHGITWQNSPLPLEAGILGAIAAGADDTVYVGAEHGLYTSVGVTSVWQATNLGDFFVKSVGVDSTGVVYAVGEFDAVQRSTDRGNTWIVVGPPAVTGSSLVIVPGGWIYVLMSDGRVWRSSDGGATWVVTSGTVGARSRLWPVVQVSGARLYATAVYSVLRLVGDVWNQIESDGLPTAGLTSLAGRADGRLFVGTEGRGVYRRAP